MIYLINMANFGKLQPTPSLRAYVPPAPVPILVKNPFGLGGARYIYAFKTNQRNGEGYVADDWNKVMDELEKLDHPRTKEMFDILSVHSWGSRFSQDYSNNQNTAVQVAGEVLSWIKAGGDNASCSKCPAKSDRLTNFKRSPRYCIGGNPPTMNVWDDPSGKLVCNECYEKAKEKAEVFLQNRIKQQREAEIKKFEEEARNICSCQGPLAQCANCISKIREAYKNDTRPACQKCGSKNNTSVLKFGSHYHRTCDDCIQYFEADNAS